MGLFNIFKKKKKINESDIPIEVLEEFNEAEEIMKNSSGEAKPYKILFDIMQEKRKQNVINNNERRNELNGKTNNTRTNQNTNNTEHIPTRSAGVPERRNIPTPVAPSNRQEYASDNKPNTGSRKLIFRRRGTRRPISEY